MTTTTSDDTQLDRLIDEFARTVPNLPQRVQAPASDPALKRLNELGTDIWLDTGSLKDAMPLWRREMSALTTNNTLANQVVQTGLMDETIKSAARHIHDADSSVSEADFVMDIAFVVNCHIALTLVSAFGARVSVELHPSIGHDMEKTLEYARRYYAVNPEHFIVKIPMTPEGYFAVARARAEGIPINFTLGFSARQNYLAALMSRPSYVNVFLGRLSSVITENGMGDGKFVGERATLASQNAIDEVKRAHPEIDTRQIAASMRNGEQMAALAGVDVYTAPPKAVEEFLKAGYTPESLVSHKATAYPTQFSPDTPNSLVQVLWDVDENFRRFAAQLAERGGAQLTADDLRAADKDFSTGLFAGFDADEQQAIREKGKIPDLKRWMGRASLDDLMTESALQSFVKDQQALDDHIRQIAASA